MRAMKILSLAITAILLFTLSSFAADSTAQFASTKPVIDAVIDDVWAKTPAQEGSFPGDNWTDDCANGYTKILWDEANIYLLAVVTDNTLEIDKTATSNSVDFWMSEMNTGDADGFGAEGDWHLCAGSFGATSYYIGNTALPDAAELATAVDGNTVIIEARVAWQTPGMAVKTGHVIGYNVSFNDDWEDDAARNAWISWQDYNGAPYWANTAALNTVELAGEMVVDTQAPETEAAAEEAAPEAPAEVVAPATGDALLVVFALLAVCAILVIRKRSIA